MNKIATYVHVYVFPWAWDEVVRRWGWGEEEVQESCTLKKCGLKTGFQMDI